MERRYANWWDSFYWTKFQYISMPVITEFTEIMGYVIDNGLRQAMCYFFVKSSVERVKEPQITWSIHARAPTYHGGSKLCQLYAAEKLAIIRAERSSLLNKQSEITGNCRHKVKFKLKNLKTA